MNRELQRRSFLSERDSARKAMEQAPRWIVIESAPGDIRCILNASDLRIFLDTNSSVATLHLLDIPGSAVGRCGHQLAGNRSGSSGSLE